MIRTQVYIPDDLYSLAKLCAEQEGVSISEYMRQGLEMRMGKELPSRSLQEQKKYYEALCGKYNFGGGETNIAGTHNDIYDL